MHFSFEKLHMKLLLYSLLPSLYSKHTNRYTLFQTIRPTIFIFITKFVRKYELPQVHYYLIIWLFLFKNVFRVFTYIRIHFNSLFNYIFQSQAFWRSSFMLLWSYFEVSLLMLLCIPINPILRYDNPMKSHHYIFCRMIHSERVAHGFFRGLFCFLPSTYWAPQCGYL